MAVVPISEARARLPELIDEVEAGAEIILTRHGKQVAVLVRPDLLRARARSTAFADAARLRERITRARHEQLHSNAGISPERAEELIAEIRADRDR